MWFPVLGVNVQLNVEKLFAHFALSFPLRFDALGANSLHPECNALYLRVGRAAIALSGLAQVRRRATFDESSVNAADVEQY